MGGKMRSLRTWALVMGGTRARILRGVEDGDGEEQVEDIHIAVEQHLRNFLTGNLGGDFPFGSGKRGFAIEPGIDPVLRDMQEFASSICDVLEQHRRAGDFTRLAIVAEQKMLGILRPQLTATLRQSIILELPMNLMALPEPDLRDRVLHLVRNNT